MRLIDVDKLLCTTPYLNDMYRNYGVVAIPWSEICKILYDRPDDHAQIRQMMYEWLWENDSEFRRKENEWWEKHSSRFD